MSVVTSIIAPIGGFLLAYYLFAKYHGRVAMYIYKNYTLDTDGDKE